MQLIRPTCLRCLYIRQMQQRALSLVLWGAASQPGHVHPSIQISLLQCCMSTITTWALVVNLNPIWAWPYSPTIGLPSDSKINWLMSYYIIGILADRVILHRWLVKFTSWSIDVTHTHTPTTIWVILIFHAKLAMLAFWHYLFFGKCGKCKTKAFVMLDAMSIINSSSSSSIHLNMDYVRNQFKYGLQRRFILSDC